MSVTSVRMVLNVELLAKIGFCCQNIPRASPSIRIPSVVFSMKFTFFEGSKILLILRYISYGLLANAIEPIPEMVLFSCIINNAFA